MTKFKESSMKNILEIVKIAVKIVCRDVCCGTDQSRSQF